MNYTIRKTHIDDLPEILELIKEFHAESLNDFGVFFDEGVVKDVMPKLIETSLVSLIDNKINGVVAGFITSHIISKESLMQEVIWFVSKKTRRSGIKLYKAFEKMCKDMKIKHIVMVNMGKTRNEVFERFYKSQGYELLEVQYIKSLEV